MLEFITALDEALVSLTGSKLLIIIGLIIFFIIAFMFAGTGFRFALIMVVPLVIHFASSTVGWLPPWIEGLFWVLIIGFGLFLAWNRIREG